MKKQTIDWDFKALNPTDYEARIDMYSDNRFLLLIFNKSKKKLAKKNINVSEQIDKIQKFPIDNRYLNMVKTILRPVIKNIQSSCREDKIELLSSYVDEGYFERDKKKNWKIVIIVKGQYADKR